MTIEKDQGLFGNTVIPQVLQPIDLVNPERGRMQPILGDGAGNIRVSLLSGDTVLQTVALTEEDYAESAGELTLFTAGINWAYDPDNVEYMRLNGTREASDFSTGETRGLNVVATNWVELASLGEWTPQTGNTSRSFFTSSSRTSSSTSSERQNGTSRAGHFIINVTALTGSPSVVFEVQAQDSLSSEWYPLLTSGSITTIGLTVLKIGPTYDPIAMLTARDNLPLMLRIVATHDNADSITYSVNGSLFP